MTKFDKLPILHKDTEIQLDEIDTENRFDRQERSEEHINDLAAVIRIQGQRIPIDVEELPQGGYALISGMSRILALQRLNRNTVRANVYAPIDPVTREYMIVEENQRRKGYTQDERIHIFLKLVHSELQLRDSTPITFNAMRFAGLVMECLNVYAKETKMIPNESSQPNVIVSVVKKVFEESRLYPSKDVLRQELERYDLPDELYKMSSGYPTKLIRKIRQLSIEYGEMVCKGERFIVLLVNALEPFGIKGPNEDEFAKLKRNLTAKFKSREVPTHLKGELKVDVATINKLLSNDRIPLRQRRMLQKKVSDLQAFIITITPDLKDEKSEK